VQPLSVMQVEKRFTRGTLLFREGDEGKEFYLIKKGEVEIFKDLGHEKRVIMTTLSKGQIFGEMAIVGNQGRAASAVCKTDCIISVAETDNLTALIRSNPDFALKIIQVFSNRLLNSERILQENMDSLKKRYEVKDRYIFGALYLMLLGFGFRANENELLIKVDLSNILEKSGLDIENVLYLLDILTRKDSPEGLAEKINAIQLNPEFEKIAERFKMNIEF
jgi:CRP-like cAMP-binding protein